MIIHPDLAALRNDDAPQRQAQAELGAALAAWRDQAEGAELGEEMRRFADGSPLPDLPRLSALFDPQSAKGQQLARSLLATLTRSFAAAPLGQVPLRHFCDDTIAMLMLARCGGASLALQAIDGVGVARRPAPQSASFSPGETWELVLAGEAEARLVTLCQPSPDGGRIQTQPCTLREGDLSVRNGSRQALQFCKVQGSLVTLKLQRRDTSGAPSREYRLSDGELLHQAASTSRDSRMELAANLLGRMGRTDAAPLLAAMAEEQGSVSLRWQALRECLGLDTAQGFQTLCAIARNSGDPLSEPAGALRAQLLEQHPRLIALDLGETKCPA